MAKQAVPEIPQNIEMEKFVLSSMLLKNGENVAQVRAMLTAEDFYRPEHRIVYQAILKLADNAITPNILSLSEELRQNGMIDSVGIEFVLALNSIAFTTAYTEPYCQTIKEKANLRRLIEYGEKVTEAAYSEKPLADILGDMSNFATSMTANTATTKITQVTDYLKNDFWTNLEIDAEFSKRKTGFENLDSLQKPLPGLYLIGAPPSVGKTSFYWQLAEQLAANNPDNVSIFVTLEMSKEQLILKSIARRIFNDNPYTRLSSSTLGDNLQFPHQKEAIETAYNEFVAENLPLTILEPYNDNIDGIINLLASIMRGNRHYNIFIDYLQIITSDKDSIKAAVDEALHKLKQFQRAYKCTVFVISSFNRTNYTLSAAFESFKESGAAEYTADVLWALELDEVVTFINDGNTAPNDIREKTATAQKQYPRKIRLTALKNRFGKQSYRCFFNYYSACDAFVACVRDKDGNFTECVNIPENQRDDIDWECKTLDLKDATDEDDEKPAATPKTTHKKKFNDNEPPPVEYTHAANPDFLEAHPDLEPTPIAEITDDDIPLPL